MAKPLQIVHFVRLISKKAFVKKFFILKNMFGSRKQFYPYWTSYLSYQLIYVN